MRHIARDAMLRKVRARTGGGPEWEIGGRDFAGQLMASWIQR
jgi:hypothetical protein